ncbi:MAG TPA: helix-turn-helix transcriptional regulator [Pirellulaceae bacterium]|nr:helix-turn-helix transcriptional regulator [Pirellulaceae bacterium]
MPKSRHSKLYDRLLLTLRETRREAGLTQTEVAAKFGAHASFVSKVESGERRIDVVELAEFCRVYGVPLTAFLARAGLA